MRSATVIILFAVIGQADATELSANHNTDMQDFLSKLDDEAIDKLADKLIDKLVGVVKQGPLDDADLDRTSLGLVKLQPGTSLGAPFARPSSNIRPLFSRPMVPYSPTLRGTNDHLSRNQVISHAASKDPRDNGAIDPWGRKEPTWFYPPIVNIFLFVTALWVFALNYLGTATNWSGLG